jgi:hypothetical protein
LSIVIAATGALFCYLVYMTGIRQTSIVKIKRDRAVETRRCIIKASLTGQRGATMIAGFRMVRIQRDRFAQTINARLEFLGLESDHLKQPCGVEMVRPLPLDVSVSGFGLRQSAQLMQFQMSPEHGSGEFDSHIRLPDRKRKRPEETPPAQSNAQRTADQLATCKARS